MNMRQIKEKKLKEALLKSMSIIASFPKYLKFKIINTGDDGTFEKILDIDWNQSDLDDFIDPEDFYEELNECLCVENYVSTDKTNPLGPMVICELEELEGENTDLPRHTKDIIDFFEGYGFMFK